jgi:hypothetical protein
MSAESPLERVKRLVGGYYKGLLPAVECGLAVFGCMSLRGRTRPLSTILETTSGYGKSAVTQMFFPAAESGLNQHAYRCDKFTPKAFVSHSANVSQDKLAAIDLLPQIKDKVLLTKELAPIFRGREEELKDTFSILIAVLDGKGFSSNSGVHGKRGYEENIVFNWLGATTPLPRGTHRLMYQLGTRLLFFEVPSVAPSDRELLEYTKSECASQAETECQEAVNNFLVAFFKNFPIGELPPEAIEIPHGPAKEITRWARFLANARREVSYERKDNDYTPVAAGMPEGPWKLINYFKELARGHALIHERLEVNAEDIKLVAHVAVSSIPGHLRPIVRKLSVDGQLNSTECTALCRVSRPTARKYLLEASLLEIGDLKKGEFASFANLGESTPDVLQLSESLRWLRTLKGKRRVCVAVAGGE